MRAFLNIPLLVSLLSAPAGPGFGDETRSDTEQDTAQQESVAPVALIRELIDKGRLDEAAALLSNIEGNDYAMLCFKGIIALKRDAPQQAITHFEQAHRIDPTRPELQLLLAQAYFKAGDHKNTHAALVKGAAAGRVLADYYLFRGHIESELQRYPMAHQTFTDGLTRFPDNSAFLRELAVVMVRAGLYATAVDYGREYLRAAPDEPDGFLVIAHALREVGRPKEAAVMLEEAHLLFGPQVNLLAALAAAYSQADRPLIAARYFERAAHLDHKYAADAAESYLRRSRWRKATAIIPLVGDRKSRLSLRLSMYLQQNRFERAVVIGEQMKANHWLEDRDRYCLAFAYTQLDQLLSARKLIDAIKTPKWRSLATSLHPRR